MRKWRDYMGGEVKNGQRQWFYALVYDESGNRIGYDDCWRVATRVKDVVTYHGSGYVDPFSDEIKVELSEFTELDKRMSL